MTPRIIDVPLPPTAELAPEAPQPTLVEEIGGRIMKEVDVTPPTPEAPKVTIVAGRIQGLGAEALQALHEHPWYVGDRGGHMGAYRKGRSGL